MCVCVHVVVYNCGTQHMAQNSYDNLPFRLLQTINQLSSTEECELQNKHTVPCANCDKTYIDETGTKYGVRLQEHRTEVESKTGRTFTRSLRASSLTEHNKSALTDHTTQENHVIN